MNANTYLLLSTVLTDRPCYDASLQSAIRTAPFAVSSIANQCFYTIFTASVARGLLLDDRSVYSRVIEGIAEQQALMEEVKIGKIMVVYSGEGCSSCQTPPSQRRASTSTSGYDHRPLTGSPNPQVVEVHFPEQHPPTPSSPALTTDGDSGAAGGAGAGAGAEQQDEQSPGSDASTWRFTPRKVVVAPRSLADLPPVLPVSSLDLRLVVVGGGTVCRRLLHVLLDERPGLLHPTRITVATRQPENLNVFATKGVLCVKPKHAREALNHCDILVLACQPGHLQAFVKTQFAPRQFETDDIYDQPARLRRNTIVFSCLAAYPIKKLGKLLHHNPALILRSDVAIEPNELPTVAAKLEETTSACTKLQVQLMADHDSFLQVAVKEAEDGEVQRHAAQLVEDQLARGELSKVPYAIAYRAAMASARTSALTRHIPPTVPDVLLAESRPSISFLCAVWMVMQSFAQATGEAEEAARQGAKQQQAASSNTEGLTAAESAAAKRRAKAKADKRRPPTTEGPFLCAALATLPASRNEVVAAATMQKHGVPTTLFPTPVTARGMETPRSYAMSTHTTGSRVPAGSEGDAVAAPEVINTALRKLPNVYTDELTLCCDLQKRKTQRGAQIVASLLQPTRTHWPNNACFISVKWVMATSLEKCAEALLQQKAVQQSNHEHWEANLRELNRSQRSILLTLRQTVGDAQRKAADLVELRAAKKRLVDQLADAKLRFSALLMLHMKMRGKSDEVQQTLANVDALWDGCAARFISVLRGLQERQILRVEAAHLKRLLADASGLLHALHQFKELRQLYAVRLTRQKEQQEHYAEVLEKRVSAQTEAMSHLRESIHQHEERALIHIVFSKQREVLLHEAYSGGVAVACAEQHARRDIARDHASAAAAATESGAHVVGELQQHLDEDDGRLRTMKAAHQDGLRQMATTCEDMKHARDACMWHVDAAAQAGRVVAAEVVAARERERVALCDHQRCSLRLLCAVMLSWIRQHLGRQNLARLESQQLEHASQSEELRKWRGLHEVHVEHLRQVRLRRDLDERREALQAEEFLTRKSLIVMEDQSRQEDLHQPAAQELVMLRSQEIARRHTAPLPRPKPQPQSHAHPQHPHRRERQSSTDGLTKDRQSKRSRASTTSLVHDDAHRSVAEELGLSDGRAAEHTRRTYPFLAPGPRGSCRLRPCGAPRKPTQEAGKKTVCAATPASATSTKTRWRPVGGPSRQSEADSPLPRPPNGGGKLAARTLLARPAARQRPPPLSGDAGAELDIFADLFA